MKLVFKYRWYVEHVAEGTETIPFEYSSKEDFQYFVLEEIKNFKDECIKEHGEKDGEMWYRNSYIKILDCDMNIGDLEDCIEHNVFELDEWFEKLKKK
jgi:hypothetical protein